MSTKTKATEQKQFIETSLQRFSDAKDDPIATAQVLNDVIDGLLQYEDTIQQTILDHIVKFSGIQKSLAKQMLKKSQQRKKNDDINNGEVAYDVIPTVDMVETFISRHYKIRYNDISNQFELLMINNDEPKWENLNENIIYRSLQKNHLKYSISDLIALLKSDFTPHYNPFHDYFDELPAWDGIDHINKLAQYIIVDSTRPGERDRFNRMFKKMLIRSVACGLEKDFNKQAFIIVHEKQNSGKSTFFRWLCPPSLADYYTENINTDKDSLIALTENFFINLDELSTLSKFEINALKSVMSKDRIKVRIPYDRRPSHIQRRCNFVGSTNRIEFLNDETGSVRWICFRIEGINWKYMNEVDIDKVWAQAYYLFSISPNNSIYQLSAAEIFENEEANRQFIIRTSELELIQSFFKPATKEKHDHFVTATEMIEKLQERVHVPLKLSAVQIGKAMAMLGFTRLQVYSEETQYTVKGYYVDAIYRNSDESNRTVQTKENTHEGKQNNLPF